MTPNTHIPNSTLEAVTVTYVTSSRKWVLIKEYTVHECILERTIRIPADFEFDLASIPRFLWRVIAPFELSLIAPLTHDWIYHKAGSLPEGVYTRAEADRIFLHLMKHEGVSRLRRTAAYLAVRTFGGRWWKGI